MRIHNPNRYLQYDRTLLNGIVDGNGWTEHVVIHEGDVLVPNETPAKSGLYCASALYHACVCVSVDPFICISHDGDMLWRMLNYKTLHVHCAAAPADIRACRLRLARDRASGKNYGIAWQRPAWWRFLHRDPRRGRNRQGLWPNWLLGSICPDFVIGGWERPYLYRWYLWPRLPVAAQLLLAGIGLYLQHPLALLVLLSPYLHVIVRSDDDRALHDHPAANLSLILRGGYVEVMPDRKGMADLGETNPTPDSPVLLRHRRAGDIVLRRATAQHRLVLDPMTGYALTVFVFGPKLRDWGFWCWHGFRHWLEFTGGSADPGQVGRGCD